MIFHLMCVHYTFSSVLVAELPRFLEIAARSDDNLLSLSFVYL